MSITILDENDNSPEFDITSDISRAIPENTPKGTKVAVVLGRDRDAGLNGLVRVFLKQQKIMKDLLCVALNIISFTLRFTALNSWQRAKKTLLPKYGALFFLFLVLITSWIKQACFPGISKVNVTFITCVSLILGCVSLNLALVLQIFTSSDCNTRSQIKLISVSHRLS